MTTSVALSLGFHALFYFTLLFVTIYSVLIIYHWFTFGTNKHLATIATVTYLVGVCACFALMGTSLLSIS